MSASITYNGVEIAKPNPGQTAILRCRDRQMSTDIVIAFAEVGRVSYGDIEIQTKRGHIVTLPCAGKKMTADLSVYVSNTTQSNFKLSDDSILITSDEKIFTVKEN